MSVQEPEVCEGSPDAAVRALLDRVRGHIRATEARQSFEAATLDHRSAASKDSYAGVHDAFAMRLAARRAEAAALAHTADQLQALTDRIEAGVFTASAPTQAALRRVEGELRASAARLEAELDQAELGFQATMDSFGQRLRAWEAAAEARSQSLSSTLLRQIETAEARVVSELPAAPAEPQPPPSGHGDRRPAPAVGAIRSTRPGRSAALLLSTGVACLGLVTLSVLLEPAVSPSREQVSQRQALRGAIFIAPPRFAPWEDAPRAPGPSSPAGALEEGGSFAAAMAAVEAGRPEGLRQVRLLAEAGAPRAQMYLARLYEAGKAGLAADPGEARRWTARAADAGDPIALHNLALYYLQGRGGPRDDEVAARLLRRAAVAGVADSQFNLGLLYETGAGVERNLVEAYKWFQVAGNNGDLKARERAVLLEAKLAPRELAAADRTAASFRTGADPGSEAAVAPGAATIAESQKKLARLGFYIGPTDGLDTPAYRQALEAYRRSQGGQTVKVASAP